MTNKDRFVAYLISAHCPPSDDGRLPPRRMVAEINLIDGMLAIRRAIECAQQSNWPENQDGLYWITMTEAGAALVTTEEEFQHLCQPTPPVMAGARIVGSALGCLFIVPQGPDLWARPKE